MGHFTFKDINSEPRLIEAYTTNGTGHVYYDEKYYYASSGAYYSFYFMYLDYGFRGMEYNKSVFESDAELKNTNLDGMIAFGQIDRAVSKPNTYGVVSTQDESIEELISDYTEFDFRALSY